jgi:protease I
MNVHDVSKSVLRLQESEAAPTVPRLSTTLMALADGELNRELLAVLVEDPPTTKSLAGRRIAILSTNGVEELELTVPMRWLKDRGATVHLVSPKIEIGPNPYGGQLPEAVRTHVLTIRHMENAGWVAIDRYLGEITASDYDAVVVPGGAWNPDSLRGDPAAQAFAREMLNLGRPLFAICHGPQLLISAGLVSGRRVTGFWSIQVDLANAGATVTDEPCVVDGNLITGRFPFDLPRCLGALEQQLLGMRQRRAELSLSSV